VYTLVIMSNLTVLNVKIDKDLKRQTQEVAKSLGLPVSTLVTSSLRDIVLRRSITITDEPQLRPEVEAKLIQLSKEAKKGKNLSPSFTNSKDALKWLHSNNKK